MTIKITVARAPLTAEFEVGSIGEGLAILSENKDKFQQLCDLADDMSVAGEVDSGAGAASQGSEVTNQAPNKRKPRNNNKAETASAPAPIPVPTTAAPTPPAAANTMPEIPDALKRSAAPPPPIMPSAPPVAPSAPPPVIGVLSPKIVAELNKRGTTDENKKALADWLATSGLVSKGATFDEAISVVQFTTDEKLSSLMAPLGLS